MPLNGVSERAPHNTAVQLFVKKTNAGSFGLSFRWGRRMLNMRSGFRNCYCFSGVAGFAVSLAGASAVDDFAAVIASIVLGVRKGLISTDFSLRPSIQTTSRRNT